jgi:hypothetical protein
MGPQGSAGAERHSRTGLQPLDPGCEPVPEPASPTPVSHVGSASTRNRKNDSLILGEGCWAHKSVQQGEYAQLRGNIFLSRLEPCWGVIIILCQSS